MAKTLEEKIAHAEMELEQRRNEIKRLLRQKREDERKARNKRWYKRGETLERLILETASLTDEQFEAFVEQIFMTEYARTVLSDILAQTVDPMTPPHPFQTEKVQKVNADETVEVPSSFFARILCFIKRCS